MKNYKGYEFFYTNGSSLTKGGGLEQPSIRPGWPVLNKYKEKYNVTWNDRDEVNWPTRLSNLLDIPVVNEAECGGGLFREIRMAYDFIETNFYKKDKFFIILECTYDHNRFDIFYKPDNSYFIVNSNRDNTLQWATKNYYPKRPDDGNIQKDFINYYNKHLNVDRISKDYYQALAGFYSYCKQLDIPIKLTSMLTFETFDNKIYDKTDCCINPECMDIFSFIIKNELSIQDEIAVDDWHPGYFGHMKYAEYMKDWLDVNLEIAN